MTGLQESSVAAKCGCDTTVGVPIVNLCPPVLGRHSPRTRDHSSPLHRGVCRYARANSEHVSCQGLFQDKVAM